MSRKQSDYLKGLLGGSDEADAEARAARAAAPARAPRMTLLNRESALARVASGEVRQVTELRLDPARCRIWPGNGRIYAKLNEAACRDLIDSLIAEGGQKVPAVVRRIQGDPDHDYEVLAGTRRHWSVSWLRANHYPDIAFLAQVHEMDDEAAFRLADVENRARKDLSDIERARNYRDALAAHYGGVQARMAERLKISKGWLSKMLAVADLPDVVVEAFAAPADLQLKPAYALAQYLGDTAKAKRMVAEAKKLAAAQAARRAKGEAGVPAATIFTRLTQAALDHKPEAITPLAYSDLGRPILTIASANRRGVTLKLHPGSGAKREEILEALIQALEETERRGIKLG